MKNKVVVILIMLILFLPSIVFADEYNGIQTNVIIGQTGQGAERATLGITRELLGKFQVIGSIVSVVALIIIGLRYMFSSIQDRADMKGVLMYYIIGAVLVFSTSNVLGIAYDVIAGLDGHTWNEGEVSIVPTCQQKGQMTYTCTTCGIQKYEVLEKNTNNHVYGEWVTIVEANCKTIEQQRRVCNCGAEEYQTGTYDVTKHAPDTGTLIEAPTCTETGTTEYKCTRCGIVTSTDYNFPVAKGHTLDGGTVTKVATCTAEGNRRIDCVDCDYYITQSVAKAPHTEAITPAVAATCTTAGKTEGKHCSVCSTVIVAQIETTKLGHDMVDNNDAVAATCTTAGRSTGKHCTRCTHTTTGETTTPALGHNPVAYAAVAATCTTNGQTGGTYCSRCGVQTAAPSTTNATGHNWEEKTTGRWFTNVFGILLYDIGTYKQCTKCGAKTDVDWGWFDASLGTGR